MYRIMSISIIGSQNNNSWEDFVNGYKCLQTDDQ